MRDFLERLRIYLDIPDGVYIKKNGMLAFDDQYSSCGHVEEEVRKATDTDRAYFLIEKTLWVKDQKRIRDEELQQLAYLKKKYKNE